MAETVNFALPIPGNDTEILFSNGDGTAGTDTALTWNDSSKALSIQGVSGFYINTLPPETSFISANCPLGGSYGIRVENTTFTVLSRIPALGGDFLMTDGSQTVAGLKTFTPNINVNVLGDIYSQFGPATLTAGIAPNNDTDELVSVKRTTTVDQNIRAIYGIAEWNGTLASSGQISGLTVNSGSTTTSTGNLTATINGGGLRGRYITAHRGTGVLSLGGGLSANINISGGNATDTYGFHSEAVSISGGLTVGTFSAFWARTAAVTGTLSTFYGLRVDSTLPGTANYQIGLDGVGAGTGIYFNTPTNAGTEYVRSTTDDNLDVAATTNVRLLAASAVQLLIGSTAITSTPTIQPSASASVDLGATSRRWRRGYFSASVDINVSTGSAPLIIASTTVCTNLNADLVDGVHVGTSGNTIPKNNTGNTFSAAQTVTTAGKMISLVNSFGGTAFDFSVNTSNVFTFGTTTGVMITTSSGIGVVLNDDGVAAFDFRVESDTNTHALFVDSGADAVGIFNATPGFALDVTGSVNVAGTTGNVYRWNAGIAAPGTTGGGTLTNHYGGDTNYLGDPTGWILVNVAGTDRKVPFYAV